MKISWTIFILCFLFGCQNQEEIKHIKSEIDKTTIRETYYLSTIVHDEHLFIVSKRHEYFIHHPDCPCLKVKQTEKEETKIEPPIVILDLIKGNRP